MDEKRTVEMRIVGVEAGVLVNAYGEPETETVTALAGWGVDIMQLTFEAGVGSWKINDRFDLALGERKD
jgi:hypothetical protein